MGYSKKDREYIWENGGGVCAICGKELDEDDWEADDILAMGHKGPLGGRPLCPECHQNTDHLRQRSKRYNPILHRLESWGGPQLVNKPLFHHRAWLPVL